MEEIRLSASQYILLGAFIGAVLGFLFGLLPYFIGSRRGYRKLGTWGLVASTVSGFVSGVISLIVVAVFLVLILKQPVIVENVSEDSSIDES